MKRLMVALGGKAAEEVFYGADQISVGATQDLREANALATDMIEKYGMGNQLHVFYKGASQGFVPKYSEYTQRTVDREVAELVQEAYHEAVRVVRDNRTTLTFWVDRLLQETVLGGEDLFTGDCGDHPLPSCDL
jgi:ATP-dependent Zn protease